MSDNLPPLPQSFTILSRLQSGTEEVVPLDMVRDYGRQCRAQALEEAASTGETVQVWCDTCEGTGAVYQEPQFCVTGSGGDFDCPDCDGRGYWTKTYVGADAIRALKEAP